MDTFLPATFLQTIIDAKAGLDAAVADLCIAIEPILGRHARRLTKGRIGPDFESADLVQEALMKVLAHLDQYSGTSVGEFVSWCSCILDNVWRTNVRRGRRRSERTISLNQVPSHVLNPELNPHFAAPSPEQEAITSEEQILFLICFLAEPSLERDIVLGHYLYQLSFVDMALQLQSSPDAVRMRCRRGLAGFLASWRGMGLSLT